MENLSGMMRKQQTKLRLHSTLAARLSCTDAVQEFLAEVTPSAPRPGANIHLP